MAESTDLGTKVPAKVNTLGLFRPKTLGVKIFPLIFRNPRKEQQELKDPEHLQQALSSYLSRIEKQQC